MDITELLNLSIQEGASDLHLSAGLPPLLRVDGDIRQTSQPALSSELTQQLLEAIMTEPQQQQFAQQLECDFALEVPGLARFRVNAFHHSRGPGAVLRSIPASVPNMAELGMGDVFKTIAEVPRGLVLVTGPTGSGKSTTLAAMLDHINSSRHQHLLTIEDPIEFVHEPKLCLVNQRELGRDTQDFSEALKSGLRQDPDIILVGEMRDLTSIRLALEAAETGHLVMGTLHTASAAKTIDRIINVFPGDEQSMVRAMLAESLAAVVSQTLLKKEGGGRVAAHEIMISTPAIRNMIREDKTAQIVSAMQTGAQHGNQTLDQHLTALVRQGVISNETARMKAARPEQIG